jgi:hypothetical protein
MTRAPRGRTEANVRSVTLLAGLLVVLAPCVAGAQGVEITPFGGYRLGGDLYEEAAGVSLDVDGAPSVGAMVDIPLDANTALAVFYTHQQARVDIPGPPGTAGSRQTLAIDHLMVGGTEELMPGRVRPFLTGALGLTRFGASSDYEVRFSVAAGGGVKLMPTRHVGLRLDGRVYAVFVDGDAEGGICAPGGCIIGLDVSMLWQAEFTAGLVLAF